MPGGAALGAWLARREAKQPAGERGHPQVPFFASTSAGKDADRRIALTMERHVPTSCPHLFRACEPAQAVIEAAGGEDDEPLLLPYLKWSCERNAAPDVTPPRLKLCHVNLLSRAVDRPGIQLLANAPVVGQLGLVQRAAQVVDMYLQSRGQAALQNLLESGQVEVLTVKLWVGSPAGDAGEIPWMIDSGRSFDTWEISMSHRGF
jgi:hypothetical protein